MVILLVNHRLEFQIETEPSSRIPIEVINFQEFQMLVVAEEPMEQAEMPKEVWRNCTRNLGKVLGRKLGQGSADLPRTTEACQKIAPFQYTDQKESTQ